MYDSKEQKTTQTTEANSQSARRGEDDSPWALDAPFLQRKQMEEEMNVPKSAQLQVLQQKAIPEKSEQQAIQLYNIGWVPSQPNTYRTTTTLVGSTAATSGNAVFGNRRYNVEADNVAQAGAGVGAVALPANHMVSDVNGAAGAIDLPTYVQAREISPECDHIVMDSEFGSNDYANARMITKGQNTNGATPRPHAPAFGGTVGAGANDVQLKLYTPLASITNAGTGAPISGPIASGTVLNAVQTAALSQYANNYNPPGWANVNNAVLTGIQAAGPGTANGITVV